MLLRPLLRPVLRPLLRRPTQPALGFSPARLFAAGEQGAWYDPSDLSSMYQDSAGTTAAVVGQPVGMILDKRLGAVRGTAVTFESAAMLVGSLTDNGNGTYTISAGGSARFSFAAAGLVNGQSYEVSYTLTNGPGGSALTDWCDSTIVTYTASTSAEVRFIGVRSTYDATFRFVDVGAPAGGAITFTRPVVRPIPGNHATQGTSASRPTLQQDGSGFYYLSFDGFDDGMVTSAIDFTGTDKMTVWAGVNKQSDAAAIITELSADISANNGCFALIVPGSAAYECNVRGTTRTQFNATTFTAPVSNVVSLAYDIAGAARAQEIAVRINGVVPTLVAGGAVDAGTGNFGNYPLYIGRRGGTTLPYNGRIYSLIVRGAASTADQIAAGERSIASKMGITL